MCSVDETEINLMSPKDESFVIEPNTMCHRCKVLNAEIIRPSKKQALCKDCFLSFVTHKFRASLGKSKLMKPNDVVLVAYSGSAAAVTLLHMLWCGLQEDDTKKLLYQIIFCYIDDGLLVDQTQEERQKLLEKHKSYVESFGFKFYYSTLSKIFEEENVLMTSTDELGKLDSKLEHLFKECSSLTSKQDLRTKILYNLLYKISKSLECNKMFTCEIQTNLAVKLLSCIGLGRGKQLASETGFVDARFKDLMILRPLLEIDEDEVCLYNKFQALTCEPRVTFSTLHPGSTSIKNLTSSFITGLQENFPSTVPTVFRTGEKLSNMKNAANRPEQQCLLCFEALDNQTLPDSYSAVQATNYSRMVSQKGNEGNSCCGDCSCDKSTYSRSQLGLCFCYGCLNIITEMKSLESLPTSVKKQMSTRIGLMSMHSQISEFLIED